MNLIPGLRTPTRGFTLLHNIISISHASICGVLRSLPSPQWLRPHRPIRRSHASTSTVILSMIIRDEVQRYDCKRARGARCFDLLYDPRYPDEFLFFDIRCSMRKKNRVSYVSIIATAIEIVFPCLHDSIFRASGPTMETDNRQSTKDDFIGVASLASLIIANIIGIREARRAEPRWRGATSTLHSSPRVWKLYRPSRHAWNTVSWLHIFIFLSSIERQFVLERYTDISHGD